MVALPKQADERLALPVRGDASGVSFSVHLVPRSSANRIRGVRDKALSVRLTAPPVDGAANRALVRFLASQLGVRCYQVEIVSGHRSRAKRVRVNGVSAADVRDRLWP